MVGLTLFTFWGKKQRIAKRKTMLSCRKQTSFLTVETSHVPLKLISWDLFCYCECLLAFLQEISFFFSILFARNFDHFEKEYLNCLQLSNFQPFKLVSLPLRPYPLKTIKFNNLFNGFSLVFRFSVFCCRHHTLSDINPPSLNVCIYNKEQTLTEGGTLVQNCPFVHQGS